MCDLIDLESPDRKGLLNSRLASPLIPAPTDTASGNCNNRINDPIPLIREKRDSLDNNPFDMVLHKTTEYIQKRDDPFEVTLEKALRPNCRRTHKSRTCSLDYADDCISKKQKNCTQKLKMNKTLNESVINEDLHARNATVNKKVNENMMIDSNNININDNLKDNDIIPTIQVQDANLSILNQSLMNDTLFDIDKESNKNEIPCILYNKESIQTEEDKLNTEQTFVSSNLTINVPKFQRSLSQGGNASPQKSRFKFMSLADPPKNNSGNESNISSLNSLNFLNEGFLKSYYSGSSVFSSLSNISSIMKLNSASSTINLSSLLSNDTINRAFLDSCLSEKSEHSKLIESTDLNKDITPITDALTKCTTSELTDQFNKLKAKLLENSDNFKEQKNEEHCTDNKLIDVDAFNPEINCSKENHHNSVSDTSSDSVFLEGSNVNKSIFYEAKLLAKTFEELALKTSSASSTDDFITNNPLWVSELLPAFDDEVDNLIELPVSPNTNDSELKNTKVREYTNNATCVEKEEGVANNLTESMKKLELELIEPVHTEKRITAATLLLELKKLIETENNLEANKLLGNLEKVLGINCENNTELLTTCLVMTNNLAKSPQKSANSVEVIENIAKNNMEQSQEDNLTNDSDNVKESPVYKNINLNDSNINKCTDTEKCLNKLNNESPKTSTEKSQEGRNDKEVNIEITCKEDSSKKESDSLLSEKAVIELLTNIGKLLTGQTEDHPTVDILKNLGRVLNFTSGNNNKNTNTESNYMEIQQTPRKSKLRSESKTNSSVPSKSVNRLNLNTEVKKQSNKKNFIRRSVSVSQTSPTKNTIPSGSGNRDSCQLEEVTKRFPSDPVITESKKNELQKDTQVRTSTTLELRKEKTATINTVKNKLKKKIDANVINKKGPMKAILPIGTMQKKETVNNKVISSYGTVTPPKSHKIISSTPNSMDNECVTKRSSRSSKPVASSTPDARNPKSPKVQSQVGKKRNFSCDISPVIVRANADSSNKINGSPKRKISSPKKTTPKRRSVGSSIPRSQTPPITKRLNSSFDVNQYDKLYESPQRTSYKTSNSQKNSPVSLKKNGGIQQSPLRDSNKIVYKAKPMKLISKLQRHSVGTNVTEKENYI